MTAIAEQEVANVPAYSTVEIDVNPEGPMEVTSAADFGKKLRAQTVAIRLHRKKWGINKKIDREHVEQAAEGFHAEADRISASKKLINSRSPAFRACITTINDAVSFWRENTVPYPEFGVRLIRKDKIAQFEHTLASLKAQLAENVDNLKMHYETVIEEGRIKLGDLFNEGDYPAVQSLSDLFGLDAEYPNVQPNILLKQLHPALYEAEQKRIQARFDEAVKLAEEAFTAEFSELVAKLAERLKLGEDGKPKMFRNEAVTGLVDFFKRFKELNVGSNQDLENLIGEAQNLIAGTEDGMELAKKLRTDVTLRQSLQSSMAVLSQKLGDAMVNKPARKFDLDMDDEESGSGS